MSSRWTVRWKPLPGWVEVACLLLITAVAVGFRLYQIGEVPPGPHYDEASATFDALDVLAGRHTVFSLRPYGREMLFAYVAAPLVALLGPGRLAIRLPTAILGILTIPATYLLVRELFAAKDKGLSQRVGLLASAFLALSFWHLALNHLSFRANYVPFLEVLCFAFLWRAIRTDRLGSYVASGIFLGLGLHTYIAARFVPIVIVVFFAALLLTRQGRTLVLGRWHRWMLLAAVSLLVFAPLLYFFLTNSDYFMLRAGGVSVFSPGLHQGDFWGLLKRSVLGNLGLFGFTGDPNWLFNIPGRPGLGLVQGVLFWLGAVLCIVRWRRPSYAFLLIWWMVMLLPSILAPDPIPHHLRAAGTLPVACILAALTVMDLLPSVLQPFRRLRVALPPLLAIVLPLYLGWVGYDTWHSYFDVWLQRDEVYYAYHGHMADLAEVINRDVDPGAVYLFPVNYDRLGEEYSEYTLELLHTGPVPFQYIFVDDASVARDLTDIVAGKRTVHLVVWTHGDHVDADPRQVLPFLLEEYGEKTGERAYRGYRVLTYELPSTGVDFSPPEFIKAEAGFGSGLGLEAFARATPVASGETAWAALQWRTREEISRDLKASLRIVDAEGHLVGQSDLLLLSNEHKPTSDWEMGQAVTSYHLIPVLSATMPGIYQLQLALYDMETGQPVRFASQAGVPAGEVLGLGTVELGRPRRPVDAEPTVTLDTGRLAPELELTGYDLAREAYAPGETMDLALYWETLSEMASDHTLLLQLAGSDGHVAAQWAREPAYPTSTWRVGDIWRDWRSLRIPPEVPAGAYELRARLAGGEAATEGGAVLAAIEIQGRARRFEAPPIGHPLPAELGDGIRLLGYDLADAEVRGGDAVRLTLFWQAMGETEVSYTVFTHLLDGDSRIWGQQDSVPGGGSLPTTSWLPGEVLIDEYAIELARDAPPGEYLLEIGMYEAETGQRLPVRDAAGNPYGDYVRLDTLIAVTR
jgi:4-amino-4-deoxy-L-arabinose transferase-like glycosyltransferase